MEEIPHWKFIFLISQGFPLEPNFLETERYKEFYEALQYVIPSWTYRVVYVQYLRHHPVEYYLSCREDLTNWVASIHVGLTFPHHFDHSGDSKFMHDYLMSIADGYAERPSFQTLLNYHNFWVSLQNVLPNVKSRQSYYTYLKQNPIEPYLISKTYLRQWVHQVQI